jgi:hypothetical protein
MRSRLRARVRVIQTGRRPLPGHSGGCLAAARRATFSLMLALSAAVLIWSPIHNSVFDWLDFRLSGWPVTAPGLVHAASHEVRRWW